MENFEQKIPEHQDINHHKKIFTIILICGVGLLVIGGVIWYNIRVSNNTEQNNIQPDSDGDMLSDIQENLLGTDPQNKDTDSDGLADYLEVQLKTDPKSAHSLSGEKPDIDIVAEKQRTQEQLEREERLSKLKQN